MYICVCKAVSEQDIRRAVAHGAHSFEEVQAVTGCSTCCGCCEPEARAAVNAALESKPRTEPLRAAA